MVAKDVALIEYSKKIDFYNCLTHAAGAVMAVVAGIFLIIKAEGARAVVSAAVYSLTLFAVYAVSAIYHGLKNGEAKRIARMIDHSTVPLLIAGTATPCALITLYEISVAHGITVFLIGWGCTLFGIISKLFFFEKLKAVTMAVYIISGSAMLFSAVPVLDKIDSAAFDCLLYGGVVYIIGAILCGLGSKKEKLHVIFHLFVIAGSAFHYFAIYSYVI